MTYPKTAALDDALESQVETVCNLRVTTPCLIDGPSAVDLLARGQRNPADGVECIRRHYLSRKSPFSDALTRCADFFKLFGTFEGMSSTSCYKTSS